MVWRQHYATITVLFILGMNKILHLGSMGGFDRNSFYLSNRFHMKECKFLAIFQKQHELIFRMFFCDIGRLESRIQGNAYLSFGNTNHTRPIPNLIHEISLVFFVWIGCEESRVCPKKKKTERHNKNDIIFVVYSAKRPYGSLLLLFALFR